MSPVSVAPIVVPTANNYLQTPVLANPSGIQQPMPQIIYVPQPVAFPASMAVMPNNTIPQPLTPDALFTNTLAGNTLTNTGNITNSQPNGKVYGIQNIGTQQYIPVNEKRHELSTGEQVAVDKALQRWFPKIVQHYGTTIPETMASPVKVAILKGGLFGLLGGLLGLLATGARATGATIGLIAGLVIGAIGGYIDQERHNGTMIELMKHFPEGHLPTKRDLLSDSAYQKDLDRRAAARASSGDANTTLLSAAVLGAALSNKN